MLKLVTDKLLAVNLVSASRPRFPINITLLSENAIFLASLFLFEVISKAVCPTTGLI